ncbi:MAG: type II toxin-antitoxin system VapC family toxin [Gemmatimonadaceae bacterium]
MILIDTNVIMYAAGAAHPNKAPSAAFLARIASGEIEATIDTAVLHEILHRYRAIGQWSDGRRVFDLTRQLFPDVLPITTAVIDRAHRMLDADPRLMAREAVHAAVVMSEGMEAVCSYDHDFDRIMGIVRQEPHG